MVSKPLEFEFVINGIPAQFIYWRDNKLYQRGHKWEYVGTAHEGEILSMKDLVFLLHIAYVKRPMHNQFVFFVCIILQ